MKIKVGDNVKVCVGRDHGKTGKVIQVFPKENRVVVEGVNIMKKHLRPRKGGEKGQRIELAAPMHASNVMLIDQKTGKATRVGFIFEGGKKMRRLKKSGAVIA